MCWCFFFNVSAIWIMGKILNDGNSFLSNQYLELIIVSGFMFVHPLLSIYPMLWNVLSIDHFGYLVPWCFIMLEKSIVDFWISAWSGDVALRIFFLFPLLIHVSVFRRYFEQTHSNGGESTTYMTGLKWLHWKFCNSVVMIVFFYSVWL